MEHSFDVELAKEYGILEAILMQNIYFWIEKNKANNKHFYDGKWWTYNSQKAFSDMFPYASERKIQLALERLINKGLLECGNYNKTNFDRTKWYSITQNGYIVLQNVKSEYAKMLNENTHNVEPIPDINTDINTDNNTSSKVSSETYKEIIEYMNTVNEHHAFATKVPFSYKANSKNTQGLINARLREGYNIEDFKDVIWWGYRKFVELEFETKNKESSYKYFRPSTLFSQTHFEEYLNEYKANTK